MNALKESLCRRCRGRLQVMVCAVVGNVAVVAAANAAQGAGEGKAGGFFAGQQACRLLVFAVCMA